MNFYGILQGHYFAVSCMRGTQQFLLEAQIYHPVQLHSNSKNNYNNLHENALPAIDLKTKLTKWAYKSQHGSYPQQTKSTWHL